MMWLVIIDILGLLQHVFAIAFISALWDVFVVALFLSVEFVCSEDCTVYETVHLTLIQKVIIKLIIIIMHLYIVKQSIVFLTNNFKQRISAASD